MKRNTIIWLLIAIWLFASIGAIIIINKHIESKDIRLRSELRDGISQIFEGQEDGNNMITFDYGFFDSPMNGGRVKNYTKVPIPPKPQKSDFSKDFPQEWYKGAQDRWKENYGDVASLWDLNWGSDKFEEREDGGWHILGIRYYGEDEACIHTFVLFPYRVALKHSEWGNYYTVPQAVSEAFDFYTSNSKSGISDRYSKGINSRIWSKIYDQQNQYYGVYKNDNYHSHFMGTAIPGGESYEKGGPIENGWMHNGYYRVYVAVSQESFHGIKKHPWNPDVEERNKLLIYWLIGIFLLCWIPITILLVKQHKESKKAKEPLRERLLRLCSPKQYIENYDKEKVTKANALYQEILATTNMEELLALADKSQKILSISVIDKTELEELKDITNPSRYMDPYDANKVELANELYSRLSAPNLSYSEFIAVKDQTKNL